MLNRRIVSLGLTSLIAATPSFGKPLWTPRDKQAAARVGPALDRLFANNGVRRGAPIFMRIFKHERVLEIFVEKSDGNFTLLKSYPICTYSGDLGPKLREGDNQAPEGFYFVTPERLNPNSSYHLSFNLGFPNAYDRAHGRTGSFLMVHGACVSIGCYAMTNAGIENIYTILSDALNAGQPFVRVHIFPFHMTDATMALYRTHTWIDFWRNLKEGYDLFETHKRPPNVEVRNKRYVFD